MNAKRFTLALIAAGALATPALAQDTWTWHKAVAAGRTVEIKGVNGQISATAASGREVEVMARKSAKNSNPDDVKLQVVEHAGGVTICAVYPSRRASEPNECQPGEKGRMNTNRNDTRVDFEVRVPRGVQFTGRTINGAVRATGMTGLTIGTTVNGDVRIATTGLARASTVNGAIDARMGQASWTDELSFSTVNGSIDLAFPESLNAEVEASTVNGSISTDWPLTVTGKWGPKRVHGRIGSGGRDLTLSTVNGSIALKRAD
ncbi:MAG TPA: DUF4097 family beta strand repeat-containing protein [Longimicrobiales bacterium]